MNVKRNLQNSCLVGLVIAFTVASGGIANAAEDPTEKTSNLVEDAVATLPELAVDPETLISDVSVPIDPAQPVVVNLVEGVQLSIGLPVEVSTHNGDLASDGSTIYQRSGDSADVSVQPLSNGVRLSTIIENAGQGDKFTYPLNDGIEPELNPDGTVSLFQPTEVIIPETGETITVSVEIGTIEAPWAVDANGQSVPTSYELVAGAVTQVLDLSSADVSYPVVADPTVVKTNIFQTRVRWNRAETATIANSGWGATGAAAVCAVAGGLIPIPGAAAVAGAVCLGLGGSAVYTAGVAQNSSPKRCLQLTLTYTVVTSVLVPWFDTYKC